MSVILYRSIHTQLGANLIRYNRGGESIGPIALIVFRFMKDGIQLNCPSHDRFTATQISRMADRNQLALSGYVRLNRNDVTETP